MKNKLLIYTTLILLIIVAFIGAFYFANIYEKKLVEPIKQVDEKQIQTIQLQPGEDQFRLEGIIYSIDTTKNPVEIVITTIMPVNRFIVPPPFRLRRTILVLPNTSRIIEGQVQSEIVSNIKITDLKKGDEVILGTYESILDILNRDIYHAFLVRRIIRN